MTNATLPETPYAFDHCDECGGPLEHEDRLWGLCASCQKRPPDGKRETNLRREVRWGQTLRTVSPALRKPLARTRAS